MGNDMKNLLIQVAGYLRLVEIGLPHTADEAKRLGEKIGDAVEREGAQPDRIAELEAENARLKADVETLRAGVQRRFSEGGP